MHARFRGDFDYITMDYSGSNQLYQAPVTTKQLSLFRFTYGLGFKRMINNNLFFTSEFDFNLVLKRFGLFYMCNWYYDKELNESSYQEFNFVQNFNMFQRV
jgi:hypothetical protein